MSIPDYQTYMLPVLKKAEHGEVKISTVVEELSEEFGLTDDEKAELLPSGKQTIIANRIHWAKSYLKQAGLVKATKRAHFIISDRGRKVLAEKPCCIDLKMLEKYDDFQDFKNRKNTKDVSDNVRQPTQNLATNISQTPDEIMRAAH